jgi:hypothetical protein
MDRKATGVAVAHYRQETNRRKCRKQNRKTTVGTVAHDRNYSILLTGNNSKKYSTQQIGKQQEKLQQTTNRKKTGAVAHYRQENNGRNCSTKKDTKQQEKL